MQGNICWANVGRIVDSDEHDEALTGGGIVDLGRGERVGNHRRTGRQYGRRDWTV